MTIHKKEVHLTKIKHTESKDFVLLTALILALRMMPGT